MTRGRSANPRTIPLTTKSSTIVPLPQGGGAAVSTGVVAAGVVILWTGWAWLDPAVSLIIVAVIVWGTWGLLRDSLAMSLNAVPGEIEPGKVLGFLTAQDGVAGVHDLHIWPMST